MLRNKLNTCCGCPYKLIVVDLNMPRMGGDQFIQVVRGNPQQNSFNIYTDEELCYQQYQDSTFVISTAQAGFDYSDGISPIGSLFQFSCKCKIHELERYSGQAHPS
jgi:hypothetical protein